MVPGMDHCAGGEGASAIDYMAAIAAWTEGGPAPDAPHGVQPVAGAPLDFFGVDLRHLDGKYNAFRRDHQAWPGRSVVAGHDAAPVADAERAALAASFPRASVLNATEKAAWELFYRSGSTAAAQGQALAEVARQPLSPLAREAVARLQAELALD